jgi:ABC-2 type transport system permease protein
MFGKVRVIAWREYVGAVRTRGFLIGLILMPVLIGSGLMVQYFSRRIVDLTPRRVAVLDRTPEQQLLPLLLRSNERRNTTLFDASGKQIRPTFDFEPIDPTQDLSRTRLEVSDRIRKGDLVAFLEIGPKVLDPDPGYTPPSTVDPEAKHTDPFDLIEQTQDPDTLMYYSTSRPTFVELKQFIQQSLQPRVVAARLKQSETTLDEVMRLFGTLLVPRGLAWQDSNGHVVFEPRHNELVTVLLPVILTTLMLVVVLIGASPLTTNIIEEKQLRIGEVLLGSVTPFQLMMGKLIGGVCTSLTLGMVYLFGAAMVSWKLQVLDQVSVVQMIGFVGLTIIASFMYGSLFVIAGAGASNLKEAQALMMPVMLIVVLPMFLVGSLIEDPHGWVGRLGTFFPLSGPLVTMFRLSVWPGPGGWEVMVSVSGSLITTMGLVWIAGRVFRMGFLLTGRPASFRELVGWVLRG